MSLASSKSHTWFVMPSAVPDRSPNGPAIPSAGLYDHRFSGVAKGIRLYLLPSVAAAFGCAFAGPATLLCTSFVLAALSGWLATYSP